MGVLKSATIGALFVGLSLTPAQANGDDLARAILGIAAVGIIAKAIDDRNDRRNKTTATIGASRLRSVEQNSRFGGRIVDGRIRPYESNRTHSKRGFKKQPLPQRCLRVVETSRGDRLAYGARCLNQNFRFASRLPDRCETAVRTNRRFRTVFGARCLRRDGWNVARY